MPMLPLSATTGVPVSRFFPDALLRTRQTWYEEFNRAFAAVPRYEELRIGQAADPTPRDRAGKASLRRPV